MLKLTETIQTILQNWHGEDDAECRSPQLVAQEIDEQMQEYLKNLPKQNAAIAKGQRENERRVA